METPSEWAKRFNQQKTGETADVSKPERTVVDNPTSVAEFPSEPFPCPACGQLLGPECRVCVSCKQPINSAEIARTPTAPAAATSAPSAKIKADSVPYPWRILFAVLGLGMILVLIVTALVKDQQQVIAVMGGVETVVGMWVFFDARRQGVSHPLRWGLGTMFAPPIVFPWYLARRRRPQSIVRFMEAMSNVRFVLLILLYFLAMNLIYNILQHSAPSLLPTPPQNEQKGKDVSPSRITSLRPMREGVKSNLRHQNAGLALDVSDCLAEHDPLANDHQA